MAAMYLFIGGLWSVILLAQKDAWPAGVMIAVITIPLIGIMAIGPLLPRNKLGWIAGCILICFGLTNLCTMIPCIFLLIAWSNRETKVYYRMTS